ncbi:exonuclease domain-containing protein [Oerskovia flava]|uniref:exonuclease domain-containing protein n=1 Tax=Oerskovia flava TaxID=2986422 RepID=UPI00223FC0B0|nr:exonuclease domain-containing protein [Oerskovia sp. JB1-3-2]
MPGFAVVDLETTGFSSRLHDRVAEVAVVLLDEAGRVEEEWCTLVNPERDLGPQHVHGIAAADVVLAPTFAVVGPVLAELLAGRVLVAHNASFDTRFLRAEFARAGLGVSIDPLACLCTMQLAGTYLPSAARGLARLCEAAGVVHDGAHSALGDARATAGLLQFYLGAGPHDPWWGTAFQAAAEAGVPARPGGGDGFVPVQRGASRPTRHWLSGLDETPAGTPGAAADAGAVERYLALLDDALLDRYVSVTERVELLAAVRAARLGRAEVEELHRGYLEAVARTRLADGLPADEVVGDLHTVAGQVGLDVDEVQTAIERAFAGGEARRAGRPRFVLRSGDEVVFTGSMARPRDDWEDDARAAGLAPWAYVTKRTRLVVAADPDSLSTKARTARRYGIPVVGEGAFTDLLVAGARVR